LPVLIFFRRIIIRPDRPIADVPPTQVSMKFDKNSAIHPEIPAGRMCLLSIGRDEASSDSQMTCIRSGIDLLYANQGKLFARHFPSFPLRIDSLITR
jgi:hypothetical protein